MTRQIYVLGGWDRKRYFSDLCEFNIRTYSEAVGEAHYLLFFFLFSFLFSCFLSFSFSFQKHTLGGRTKQAWKMK